MDLNIFMGLASKHATDIKNLGTKWNILDSYV